VSSFYGEGRDKENREYYGIILYFDRRSISFKRRGNIIRLRNSLIGEVLGEEYLKFLKVQLNHDIVVNPMERVCLDGPYRRKVARVIGLVRYQDLSPKSREVLEDAIEKVVRINELKWVDFFNKSGLFTHKVHVLELLPGITKKKVDVIVDEREAQPFASFKDIRERTGIDPVKSIKEKILEEITGDAKYYILTRNRD